MRQANWTAGYDIRVDMQAEEHPVTLIYKAAITQNTGEVRFALCKLGSPAFMFDF